MGVFMRAARGPAINTFVCTLKAMHAYSRNRRPRTVPRRGHVLVTVTAVDENGFVHQYADVETPSTALRDAVATLHAAASTSTVSDAEARTSLSAG